MWNIYNEAITLRNNEVIVQNVIFLDGKKKKKLCLTLIT